MAKIDYTEAERRFIHNAEEFRKGKIREGVVKEETPEEEQFLPSVRTRKETVRKIRSLLKEIAKEDLQIYDKLSTTAETIQEWNRNFKEIDIKTWKVINALRHGLQNYMESHRKNDEDSNASNSLQVEQELLMHIDKRHKVKKGWRPV